PAPAQVEEVELSERIYFDSGVHSIRHDQRRVVEEMCELVRTRPNVIVRVVGYADDRGSPAFNQRLSSNRAGTIAQALVRCGLHTDRIEAVGRGQRDRTCEEATDACRQRNRRVHFFLVEP
ncbi:MAG: OmpA family protein, partial [Myxococcales bacterium]|nr:OmpA family protein [Myxococcales bacterium]